MGEYSVGLAEIAENMHFEIINKPADFDKVKIRTARLNRPGLQLAGYYEGFDPHRIQLIGEVEDAYMKSLEPDERRVRMRRLIETNIPALVMCSGLTMGEGCRHVAEDYGVTVFRTDLETSEIIAYLTGYLSDCLAPRVTQAGVFVEIYGEGVLITGESGVGKSEAALELIKRGHLLIADDAVEIKRVLGRRLIGTAPELIRYYMELRGVGVIDVRSTFGIGAVKDADNIDMVVRLEEWNENTQYDRLGTDEKTIEILGISLPYLTVPIKPGRNVAVILEIAAMNNRQKKMGHNSAREFTERINRFFDEREGKN